MAADEPAPSVLEPAQAFTRQMDMEGWDDELVARQSAFLVGTGGVGNSFGMALCRMGVKHITCLDMDVVDVSNLNRQVLFNPSQVGKRKVDAATETLNTMSVRTSVKPMHCNAVTNWAAVVTEARSSTVIFNGCDYGAFFDHAVTSLSRRLALPCLTASTYAYTMQTDAFSGRVDDACWCCNNFASVEVDEREFADWTSTACSTHGWEVPPLSRQDSATGRVQAPAADAVIDCGLADILSGLKRDRRMEHPILPAMIERSIRTCHVEAVVAAGLAARRRAQRDQLDQANADPASTPEDRSEMQKQWREAEAALQASDRSDAEAAAAGRELRVTSVGEARAFKAALDAELRTALAPDRILGYDSLSFIPKDPKPSTASIGSWVCVCAIGSMMAVNIWAQMLTGSQPMHFSQGSIRMVERFGDPAARREMQWPIMKFVVDQTGDCPVCGVCQAHRAEWFPDQQPDTAAAEEEAEPAAAEAAAAPDAEGQAGVAGGAGAGGGE